VVHQVRRRNSWTISNPDRAGRFGENILPTAGGAWRVSAVRQGKKTIAIDLPFRSIIEA